VSPAEADPYREPTSGVLRNRLRITNGPLLAQAEADFSAVRLAQLRHDGAPGRYDLNHLCALHRHIFADVYPWAGEIRTVVISKGRMFCMPRHIEPAAAEVFARLAARDDYGGWAVVSSSRA
jgi:cell filamentation protein